MTSHNYFAESEIHVGGTEVPTSDINQVGFFLVHTFSKQVSYSKERSDIVILLITR